MQDENLELIQRLVGEGKTREEIIAAMSASAAAQPAVALIETNPLQNTISTPVTSPISSSTQVAETPGVLTTSTAPIVSRPSTPVGTSTVDPSAAVTITPAKVGSVPALPATAVITLPEPQAPSPEVPFFPESPLISRLGWPLIGLICLIPIIIISLDSPFDVRFGSPAAALLTLGDITGVIGLAMYALNTILATRLRVVEAVFGGLNRVYIAHIVLGSLALLALLLHPLLTAFSYYPSGVSAMAVLFVPRLSYLPATYGIIALLMIIGLVCSSLFVKLSYRLWLQIHRLLGLAYVFVALHVLTASNSITSDGAMKVYLYFLLIVGAAAYIYRTLLPNIFIRRYLYTIKSAVPKGVGTVEVTMAPVRGAIKFRAGQFIFISFDTDGLSNEWHPFSVSSGSSSRNLTIDIRSLGSYTETITRLLPHMEGMTVRVEGAYGRFSYQNFRNPNQVWVAGGIGITPFLSMAQSLGQGQHNIDLYYSVRTQSELIDLEVLSKVQSAKPGQSFRVFPFMADTFHTYLNADIIAHNTGNLAGHDFLLCGPPPMMHSLKAQLITLGVPKTHIHAEEFTLN